MNVNTLDAPPRSTADQVRGPVAASPRSLRPADAAPTTTPRRPGRRTGRGTGPEARPARRSGEPALVRGRVVGGRSCSVAGPAVEEQVVVGTGSWRLTDRGIALVLVTALMIATAALAVVGLTALRVTGDRYSTGQGSTAQATSILPVA